MHKKQMQSCCMISPREQAAQLAISISALAVVMTARHSTPKHGPLLRWSDNGERKQLAP